MELWVELTEEAAAWDVWGEARNVEGCCGGVDGVGFGVGLVLGVGMLVQPLGDG